MADATPTRAGWAFRPVPPTPRSIAELICSGTLDAELAAMLWVLIEGRVPVIVAGQERGTGKTTVLGALLDFLPAGVRMVELAGSAETFEWLPQASELGWTRDRAATPRPRPEPPVRPDTTVLLVPEFSDHLPSYTWGAEARIAIRAASIGYGLAATIHGDTLEAVFEQLGRPPVRADDDELSRLGVVLILRRRRRRSSSGRGGPLRPPDRPRRARPRPAARPGRAGDLGPGLGPLRALRLGRDPGARAAGRAQGRRLRDRARSAPRLPGRAGGRGHRSASTTSGPPIARLLAYACTTDRNPDRSRPLRTSMTNPAPPDRHHPRRAAGLGLAIANRQGGAARQPPRSASRPASEVLPGRGRVTRRPSSRPIENAILAGQDLVFLGERGQAKTRMARAARRPARRVAAGGRAAASSTTTRSRRFSPAARAIGRAEGDDTPIDWLPRDRRYAEKLATPDITIADLIGEVDPIKVAEGRYLVRRARRCTTA